MIFFDSSQLLIGPHWLVLIGVAVGTLSGLLGVGGGILLTPALHILGMSMPAAVATTLTQMVGSSLSGAVRHAKNKNINITLALLLGLPSVLGMHIGHLLMEHMAEDSDIDTTLGLLYLGLMCYLAWSIYVKLRRKDSLEAKVPRLGWWCAGPKAKFGGLPYPIPLVAVIGVGLLVGLLSALTGLGGGFLYVPAIIFLTGLSLKQAVGTSLLAVAFSCIYGAMVYWKTGLSNMPVAFFLMSGSLVGAQLGAWLAHKSASQQLLGLFLGLVVSALGSMLLKLLDFEFLAHILLFGSNIIVIALGIKSVWLKRAKV